MTNRFKVGDIVRFGRDDVLAAQRRHRFLGVVVGDEIPAFTSLRTLISVRWRTDAGGWSGQQAVSSDRLELHPDPDGSIWASYTAWTLISG